MISEPSRRISACSKPTALLAASSERNEIGADEFGEAVGAMRLGHPSGRISCSTTGMPALATCQAASEPGEARADDVHGLDRVLVPVNGHTGSAFPGAVGNAQAADTTTPAARRAFPFVSSAKKKRISRYRVPAATRGNVRAIKADIGQFAIAKLGQFADNCADSPGTPGSCG